MTETRIRWHRVDGTVVRWFGFVGTATMTALFQILHPVATQTEAVMGRRFDEWALCTTFPGASAEARYGGWDDGAPDRLKAEAERWLEELVSSLGASFPPEPDESAAFRLSEAREVLADWDTWRDDPDGRIYDRERVLADQVRTLLAIADREAAPTGAGQQEDPDV